MMLSKDNKTILLVEDEIFIAMDEKMILEKYGFRVLTAATGEKAIEIVESNAEIDLILMDINLGDGIDGTTAASRILELHDLPLIFLSSHTSREVVEKTEGITSYGYIVKDSGETVLIASIKMAFRLFEAKLKEKVKEEALHTSEAHLRNLLDALPDLVWLKNPDGVYLSCNSRFERFFGASEAEIVGKKDYDFVEKELADFFREKDQAAMAAGKPCLNEEEVTFADDGHKEILETIKTPMYDASGNIIGVLGIARDITERKHMESQRGETFRALSLSEERLHLALRAAGGGVWDWNLITGEIWWSEEMYQLWGFPSGTKLNLEDVMSTIHEQDREYVNIAINDTIEHGKDYYCEFRIFHPEHGKLWIISHGNVFCDETGKAIRLLSISLDITERKLAENILKEKDNELMAIFENTPVAMVIINKEQKIVKANRIASGFTGRPVEGLLGLRSGEALRCINSLNDHGGCGFGSSCESCPVRQVVKDTIETGNIHHNVEAVIPIMAGGSRSELNLLVSTSHINVSGKIMVLVSLEDISKLKRAEIKAHERENRFLFENMMDGFALHEIVVDHNNKPVDYIFLEVNPAFERLTGLKREDIISKKVTEALPGIQNDPADWIGRYGKVALAGKEIRFVQYARPLKKWFSVLAYSPQKGRFATVFNDITELKNAENALRKNQEWMQAILESAGLGLWDRDFQINKLTWNKWMYSMLGHNPDDSTITDEIFLNYIHKDDRNKVKKSLKDVYNSNITKFANEFRIVRSSGEVRWIAVRGYVFRDEDGQPVRMSGVNYDITDQKHAENALAEETMRRRILVQQSRDGMVVLDRNGKVYEANKQFAKMLGYSHEEIHELHVWDWEENFTREQVLKLMKQINEEGNYLQTRQRRKDGSIIDVEINSNAATFGGQKLIFSVCRDITDRKKAEEEIKRQLSEKETLLKEVHHRIKNHFQSMGAILSMQKKNMRNPDAIAEIQAAIGRISSMKLLYAKLLITEDYKDISVRNYLDNLIDTIATAFLNNPKIKLERQIDDFYLDAKRLFSIGIIVNELLTNVLKYAFNNNYPGLIDFSVQKNENHLTLIIRDNGKGLPENFDIGNSKGFGLSLVKMLSQQLKGTFTIESREGTISTLEFDI